jgi:peptide chain release factor 2
MRQIDALRESVQTWRTMEKSVHELIEMSELASNEHDDVLMDEINRETTLIGEKLNDLEFQLILSDTYDKRNAIIALHAGAGGTESQDWADMLLRMYLRWAERNGFKAELLDTSPGEETGIKSATLHIKGNYGYGYLKAEHGVHRLVRLSPFDSDHARHTSFALIEVLPEAEPIRPA